MSHPKYPSLYQINTRVWLTEFSRTLGRKATLDDIPDLELDRLREMGFDWIWFLSVWSTGEKAQKVSRENLEWRHEFEATLPDLRDEDIAGSGFAITGYTVHPDLGGDEALARLRVRLKKRNLKLLLDFVPNHMGPDHPWVESNPDYFVPGTQKDLEQSPKNFIQLKLKKGNRIFAFGRDPYFDGWPDTLQLDYSNPGTQDAMEKELLKISGQCDGVRCDMAMLVLPEVFKRTWGRDAKPFWPRVTKSVRKKVPEFLFMAEVYWDMEWTLQQQGFDYTYDKRLYDRLHEGQGGPVREHLRADLPYQEKMARFLENHDEPRAAATFDLNKHEAAAIITFLSPGLRFFHQGQFEGKRIRISPHLVRGPQEPIDTNVQKFYTKLLEELKNSIFRDGQWRLMECIPAWDGNGSSDSFIAFAWESTVGEKAMVVVNYAPHASQCYARMAFNNLEGKIFRFKDTLNFLAYDRERNDLLNKGMYLDMPAWGYHVFELSVLEK